jgi:hypothetical protein
VYTGRSNQFNFQWQASDDDLITSGASDIGKVKKYVTVLGVKEVRGRPAKNVSIEVMKIDHPIAEFEVLHERLRWQSPRFLDEYADFIAGGSNWAVLSWTLVNFEDRNKTRIFALSQAPKFSVILAVTWDGKWLDAFEIQVEGTSAEPNIYPTVTKVRKVGVRELRRLSAESQKTWERVA